MSTKEIADFVAAEIAPKYDKMSDNEKYLYHAILQSLSLNDLEEVESYLYQMDVHCFDLFGFIHWLKQVHSKPIEEPNEPISTLLNWYEDKNSKKVSHAYNRLTKRYSAQSYSDQKKIMRAFLSGSKSSSEWAAKRLREHWIPELENEITVAWETYKGPAMARAILYSMPEDFVLKNQETLVKAASGIEDAYPVLCGRLGRNPNFKIDEKRLGVAGWFYMVGKLEMTEKIPEIDGKLDQFLREKSKKSDEGLLVNMGYSRIIWAMKKVGYTEGLIRLARIKTA